MRKSRGGLSTKIHAAVDALGNPLRLLLGPGQSSEIRQAQPLLEGLRSDHVIADKGHDADSSIQTIEHSGAVPVIPPGSNRKTLRYYDKYLYQERNLAERVFQKLKHYPEHCMSTEKQVRLTISGDGEVGIGDREEGFS